MERAANVSSSRLGRRNALRVSPRIPSSSVANRNRANNNEKMGIVPMASLIARKDSPQMTMAEIRAPYTRTMDDGFTGPPSLSADGHCASDRRPVQPVLCTDSYTIGVSCWEQNTTV